MCAFCGVVAMGCPLSASGIRRATVHCNGVDMMFAPAGSGVAMGAQVQNLSRGPLPPPAAAAGVAGIGTEHRCLCVLSTDLAAASPYGDKVRVPAASA